MNEVLPSASAEKRTKLLLMVERFLNSDSSSEQQNGDNEYKGKVIAFFKDMNLDLQDKQLQFGSQIEKALRGMALSEDKLENLKAVAVVFSKQSRTISQEILNEAKEFFAGYKDELKDSRVDFPGNFQIIANRKK
nr:uncharacterized protein LOC122271611 [Parasteatoda tepidariorum]